MTQTIATASRWRTTTIAAVGLALACTGLPAAAQATPGSDDDHDNIEVATDAAAADPSQRLLVLWEAHVTPAERAAVLDPIGTLAAPSGALDTVTVPAARAADLPAIARRLAARADVAAAEVDRPIALAQQLPPDAGPTLAPRPDDPLYGEQWGLENSGQLLFPDGTRSTRGVDVRARAAWSITEGNPSITVAVVDAGIDITHPDIEPAIWINVGESPDGVDSDGNGFVDDVNGYDFIADQPIIAATETTPALSVGESHGTQVAGVIVARSRDAFGTAGMAPQVSLMPIRAFEQVSAAGAGSSDLDTIVRSINYAVDNGADVINASWESPSASSVLQRAIADAGVPVVAAAGNRGLDLSVGGAAVPASYLLPNLVAVTAIDPRAALPAFANIGADTIDLGAPGVAIVTTDAGGGHKTLTDGAPNGTSFAAPFVSGALALGLSAEPATSMPDLLDALLRTTTPRPSLVDRTTTGGSLDAGAFLAALSRPVCGRDDLALAGFSDVAPASTHARAIDCIADARVTAGFADGTYRPERTVTRGQLATFLTGVVTLADALPDEAPDAFEDDNGTTHEASIDVMAALGVLEGDAKGRVNAGDPVTRGQLASMLVRTYEAIDTVERAPSRSWFPDVSGTTHATSIGVARDLGLVRGVDRVTYDASARTRRDQMASTLARLLDALARDGVTLEVETS